MGDGSEGGHSDPPEGLQTSACWQLLLRNLLALGSPTPKVPKYSKPPGWSSLELFFCWRITWIDQKCCSTTLECEIGALSSAKNMCDSTWPREKAQRSVNIRFRRAPPRHAWLNLITFNLKTACVCHYPSDRSQVWECGQRVGGRKRDSSHLSDSAAFNQILVRGPQNANRCSSKLFSSLKELCLWHVVFIKECNYTSALISQRLSQPGDACQLQSEITLSLQLNE